MRELSVNSAAAAKAFKSESRRAQLMETSGIAFEVAKQPNSAACALKGALDSERPHIHGATV